MDPPMALPCSGTAHCGFGDPVTCQAGTLLEHIPAKTFVETYFDIVRVELDVRHLGRNTTDVQDLWGAVE